ncbi:MAG: nuclear transport factor 2 family protein [Rhodobacter sp.]|nr:nuclear transport factor 2 family protein [Rhodobacter sp.]
MTQSIQDFFAAWGEPNDDTAYSLLEGAISPTRFAYYDPKAPQAITSVADMAAMLAGFPPGASALVIGEVDLTKAYARATVKFDFGGGQGMVGQYFFDLDEDKRILRAVGFPGPGGQ